MNAAPEPVRQRATLVLPSSGAFDSRAWRIATALAARGHDVTVMGRLGPGVAAEAGGNAEAGATGQEATQEISSWGNKAEYPLPTPAD